MKSLINHSSLTSEEIDTLKNDVIGNNKYTQQVCNTAKKIFTTPLSSNDPNILKHTDAAKEKIGDNTRFFREHLAQKQKKT